MPRSKRPGENKCRPALIESHFHIVFNQISPHEWYVCSPSSHQRTSCWIFSETVAGDAETLTFANISLLRSWCQLFTSLRFDGGEIFCRQRESKSLPFTYPPPPPPPTTTPPPPRLAPRLCIFVFCWPLPPPPPDKLHNNHPVSGLPPGLRFQFCAAVPRRSHELTLKFCSGGRGSGSAVAPLWQLASQTISERVRDCTAALESITASHLRLFPHGAALHERWSTRSL